MIYPAQWDSVPTFRAGGLAYPPPPPPPSYSYPMYNQALPSYPPQPFYPPGQFPNPMLGYGGIGEPQMSPVLAALVRQHFAGDSFQRF